MVTIKRDTIIKKGDHLIDANGEKWEVKAIEGLYFTIINLKTRQQRQTTKSELSLVKAWQMVIMDDRNYW